jgi:site-specific DNA-methyltransferase (adenine-specific)
MGHTPESVSARPLRRNYHETVKPTALMRYLVRLVTPPGGIVLDPFMGSGSTGKAAVLEGFSFTGIELDAGYFAIAEQRIAHARRQPRLAMEGDSAQAPVPIECGNGDAGSNAEEGAQ